MDFPCTAMFIHDLGCEKSGHCQITDHCDCAMEIPLISHEQIVELIGKLPIPEELSHIVLLCNDEIENPLENLLVGSLFSAGHSLDIRYNSDVIDCR